MLGMVPHDFTEFLPDDLARDPQALERFRRSGQIQITGLRQGRNNSSAN
jgi:hypothetical protein